MPRSLVNAYWIEVGVIRERERVLELPFVHELFGGKHPDDCNTCYNLALIKGEYDA